jgi:glutamine amidotransferase
MKLIITDLGMGNMNSIYKRLNKMAINTQISDNPNDLLKADKIILPGVGHFENAVLNLIQKGFWDILQETVLVKKTPILGICLGMQLMAKTSEEGNCEGLGWIDADVVRFNVKDKLKHKVPHMGWNEINLKKDSRLMENIPELSEFYFVHSYHMKCHDQNDILNTCYYDYEFVSAVEKDNIFGVQYHPEKSHHVGEQLLQNFIDL